MSRDTSGDKSKLEINIEEQETSKRLRQSNDPRDYLVRGLVSRDDPKWDWLRNLGREGEPGETVFGKVRKYVELPYLGNEFLPKELDDEMKLKNVFITPHRVDVLKIMWDMLHLGVLNVKGKRSQAGCILSGPNGIGKTVQSYLMVCAAYVNKAIVIYVPLARAWVATNNEMKIYQSFLERFLLLNADLAAELPCRKQSIVHDNLFQLARAGFESDDLAKCQNACEELMEELSRVIKYPVLYAIDEHNEIWKANKQNHFFIGNFTVSTGLCAGYRTFLLISGSAHSIFLNSLQPGLERWLVRMQPFDFESFRLAVSADPSSENFALPASLVPKHLNYLYEATGGLPREILKLRKFLSAESQNQKNEPSLNDVVLWVSMRSFEIEAEIEKWVQHRKERIKDWKDFLAQLVKAYLKGEAVRIDKRPPASLWDQGYVYFDEEKRSWKIVSAPAFRILQAYHFQWQHEDLCAQPLDVIGYDKKHKMENIKEKFVDQFANAVLSAMMRKINEVAVIDAIWAVPTVGDDWTQTSVVLPRCVEMRPFNLNLPRNVATLPSVTTIFVPEISNFMAFDAILCSPPQSMNNSNLPYKIVFIQISLTELHRHEETSQTIKKAFGLVPAVVKKRPKKQMSKKTKTEAKTEEILEEVEQLSEENLFAVKILRWLTNNHNLTIKLSGDSRQWEVNGWQESNPLEIEVIYITAQKEAVVKYWCRCRGGPKTRKFDPKEHGAYLPFVKIITREKCMQHFGINFVEKVTEEIPEFPPKRKGSSGLQLVPTSTQIATKSKTTSTKGRGKQEKKEDEEFGPNTNLEVSSTLLEEEEESGDVEED
jgi:hypothetical protein